MKKYKKYLKFSDNFRKYRVQLGMTQEEVAHKLDVCQDTISKWELGKSYPNLIYTHKILGLFSDLNLTLEDFLK